MVEFLVDELDEELDEELDDELEELEELEPFDTNSGKEVSAKVEAKLCGGASTKLE